MGHDQFNHLVSSMNIVPVSHHTIKRAEKRVGPALENQAHQSVKRALLEEKELTEKANRCVLTFVQLCCNVYGNITEILRWLFCSTAREKEVGRGS